MFITTKRLISLATEAKHILADATYKLVYEGYPSLTIRTTDKNKNFHHFGIGITTNEKHEDYAFLFKALKYTVEAVEGVEYEPDTLIADNAHGITNGLLKVFNLKKVIINSFKFRNYNFLSFLILEIQLLGTCNT